MNLRILSRVACSQPMGIHVCAARFRAAVIFGHIRRAQRHAFVLVDVVIKLFSCTQSDLKSLQLMRYVPRLG